MYRSIPLLSVSFGMSFQSHLIVCILQPPHLSMLLYRYMVNKWSPWISYISVALLSVDCKELYPDSYPYITFCIEELHIDLFQCVSFPCSVIYYGYQHVHISINLGMVPYHRHWLLMMVLDWTVGHCHLKGVVTKLMCFLCFYRHFTCF